MSINYVVHIKVFTPVGSFTGHASELFNNIEEASEYRDSLQSSLNNYDSFTIMSDEEENVDITLHRSIIQNSVIVWSIKDIEI